jgi:NAD(P)-dependent dehydrogenase (short-subunit alcohol dehydrogenase family)
MLTLQLLREVELSRSIDDCFRYLEDFSTTEQWDPGVLEAEKTTPGAPGPGTAFALHLDVLGRAVPARYRLVEREPHRRLVLEGEGPGFRVTDRLDFGSLGPAATRLRYEAAIRMDAAPGAASGVIRPWGDRLANGAMRGLTAALCDDGPETVSALGRVARRLLLPAAMSFTRRGYRDQRSRGLSRRLDGRTVAITGVTSGLGLASAQELARLGARVLLIGRGTRRLDAAASLIRAFAGPCTLVTYEAELSSIAATHELADRLLAAEPRIDVLVNNAGALFSERGETAEGNERTLAVNLLTPALLAKRLEARLSEASGRVINVVSGGLYMQSLALGDLDSRREPYDGAKAYARAKRGLLALTRIWASDAGPLAWHAVHPGWAATPGVSTSLPTFNRWMGPWLRNPRQGADTMVWLASHPALGPDGARTGFWFDRARQPDAVLPGTAVDVPTARALEAEVRRRARFTA